MNTVEYLKQIRKFDSLIEINRGEIASLRLLADGLKSATGERVSGSGSGDRIARTIETIDEKERKLAELVDYYIETREQIVRNIEALNDPVLIQILYGRYFKGQTWEHIAVDMGYTYRHVQRLHDIAIKKLSKHVAQCHIQK